MTTPELIVSIVGTLAWPACIVSILLMFRPRKKRKEGELD